MLLPLPLIVCLSSGITPEDFFQDATFKVEHGALSRYKYDYVFSGSGHIRPIQPRERGLRQTGVTCYGYQPIEMESVPIYGESGTGCAVLTTFSSPFTLPLTVINATAERYPNDDESISSFHASLNK